MKKLLGATLMGLFGGACAGGAGIAPPVDRLFFPSSVVADDGGRKLYVSNGNFNAAFDGGTITVLDLVAIEADGQACRAAQVNNTPPPDGCQITAPTPPTLCVTAGGRCSTQDFTTKYIDKEATVVTASFGGDFVPLPGRNRVFSAVRGDQSLSFFDFDPAATGVDAIDCAAEIINVTVQPNEDAEPVNETRRVCGGDHILLSDRDSSGQDRGLIIPGFVSGVFTAALDLNRDIPGVGATDLLYVSHLDNGFLSLFRLTPEGRPLFQRSEFLNIGVNQMAVHPLTGLLFVIRRTLFTEGVTVIGNSIEMVQPRLSDDDGSQLELFSRGSIRVDILDSGGVDYRSIAFSSDGTRLFIGMANPSSVLVLDTSLDAFGDPKNQVIARVDVDPIPEQMRLVQADNGEFLYIADFNNSRLHMIDTALVESGGARATIDVGTSPFGLAQFTLPTGEARLVVSNFGEDTLSFIDLDPASPTYNQVLYRVGAPRPAEEN